MIEAPRVPRRCGAGAALEIGEAEVALGEWSLRPGKTLWLLLAAVQACWLLGPHDSGDPVVLDKRG